MTGEEREILKTINDDLQGNDISRSDLYAEFYIYFEKISIPILIWHPYKNGYALIYYNQRANKFFNHFLKDSLGDSFSLDNPTNYEYLIDFNDCLSNNRTIKKEIKLLNDSSQRNSKFIVEYKPLQTKFLLMQVLESIPDFVIKDSNNVMSVIDNLPASVIITNNNGDILYTNQKFSEVTGYSANEAYGKNPRILKSDNKTPEQYKELWDTILSGKEWKGEFLNKKKGGEFYWESAVISPIKNSFNEITNFIAVKEDITEKKKTEEELRKNEKLAAIGKMTTYISHEIRSPLTSIKLNIDILSHKLQLHNNQEKSFNIIQKEIKRLDSLLKDILQFSRDKNLVMIKIDIHKMIESVKEFIHPILKKNNIKLKNNIGNIFILGDSFRLQSLFLHLIENSIDAIGENGTIEFYSQAEQCENKVIIFIKDTGSGIEDIQKVFDPFFTTKSAGTGLGLAIVKKIIEKHNGTVELKSSKKGETIFRISFPMLNN